MSSAEQSLQNAAPVQDTPGTKKRYGESQPAEGVRGVHRGL